MNFRASLAVLFPVVLVGCGVIPSCEKENPTPVNNATAATTTPARCSEGKKETLHGLQSLTRVRVRIPGATEASQAEVSKQLHELLPQLDTAGTDSDWTLEFVSSMVWWPDDTPISSPRLTPPWEPKLMKSGCAWYCRLVRKAVVGGRMATAVAYEDPLLFGAARVLWQEAHHAEGVAPEELSEETRDQLRNIIAGFANEWRKANPDLKTK